jgi:hypothetical protein
LDFFPELHLARQPVSLAAFHMVNFHILAATRNQFLFYFDIIINKGFNLFPLNHRENSTKSLTFTRQYFSNVKPFENLRIE